MRKFIPIVPLMAAGLLLTACGHNLEQRAATGALGGAAVGAVVNGGVGGALVGGAIGAGAGVVVNEMKK